MSRRRQRKSAFSLFAFQDIITAVTGIMLLITLLLTLELVDRKAKASQEVSAPPTSSKNVTVSKEKLSRLETEVAAMKKKLKVMITENTMLAKYDDQQLHDDLQKTREANRERRKKTEKLLRELSTTKPQHEKVKKIQDAVQQVDVQIRQAKAKLEKIKKSSRIFIRAAKGSRKTNWLVEISENGLKIAQLGLTAPPTSFSDAYEFQTWLSKQDRASNHFVLLVTANGIALYSQVNGLLEQKGYSKGFDVLQQNKKIIDDTTGAGIP